MDFSSTYTFQTQNQIMRPVGLKIISIEGNIGSGKSTIIDIMENMFKNIKPNYIFLREPVDVWESIKDTDTEDNILKKFYKEPKKYGFSFQVLVYITFYKQIVKAINESNGDNIIICERSLDVSQFIFAKMLYDDDILNEVEYQIIKMFYSQFDKIKLDAVIYLDVDINTCKTRIQKRSRIGEEEIKLNYLKRCRDYHENWLNEISNDIVIKRINGELNQEDCLFNISSFIMDIEEKYDIDSISDYNSDKELLNDNISNERSNSIVPFTNEEIEYTYPIIPNRMLQESTQCDNCFNRITYLENELFVFRKKGEELYWCSTCYAHLGYEMLEEGWKLKGYDA